MERYLEGQGAIVTGGMRGIGFGIARKLHDRGAQIGMWTPTQTVGTRGKMGFGQLLFSGWTSLRALPLKMRLPKL